MWEFLRTSAIHATATGVERGHPNGDREGAGEIYASGKPKDQPSVSIVVLRGLTFLVSRCLAGNALAEEAQRPKTVAPLTDIVINIISRQRLGKKEEAQRPKAVASLTS